MSDRVKNYSQYNTTLRLYENFNTLNVFFFYNGTLPEGTRLRVTHADGVPGDYGSAPVEQANLTGTDPSLLTAKIFTTTLAQCDKLTLMAETPDGMELFQLNYALSEVSYPSGTVSNPNKNQQNDSFTVIVPGFEPPGNAGMF
ncbi:MAG: hypothetical protein PUC00_10445 [Clostridiales bacterium]|nr:hypothetical protein [Clostridiales bacterium]